MFGSLSPADFETVLDSIDQGSYCKGSLVITQGDLLGDCMYIVESGHLECYKTNSDTPYQFLKEYHSGDFFGELALLYNTPRAASIKAVTDCKLWKLDRETFKHIVRDSA